MAAIVVKFLVFSLFFGENFYFIDEFELRDYQTRIQDQILNEE